jgi:hypothetical protein
VKFSPLIDIYLIKAYVALRAFENFQHNGKKKVYENKVKGKPPLTIKLEMGLKSKKEEFSLFGNNKITVPSLNQKT